VQQLYRIINIFLMVQGDAQAECPEESSGQQSSEELMPPPSTPNVWGRRKKVSHDNDLHFFHYLQQQI
jgi:hypothetical protein